MRILLSWLRDFVPYDGSPEELGEILTHLGHAVESMERIGGFYTGVVVGRVVECGPVAGSDHLSFCKVDAGSDEPYPVICGAPNVAAGQKVALAIPGATLPGGLIIGERKMRGVLSRGMICSERELGLSEEHKGIIVLREDCVLGRPVQEYLGGEDWLYDLEVTFNRPDCLCHLGVAREVAAKTGLKLKMPEAKPIESKSNASELISVEIRDPERCPRYSARVVKGVKVGPSPEWMQRRLKAVGIRPISNVVDVTNYVMMEVGHPLHAFDYHLVKDGKIIVRRAEKGEKFTTLDGKEHTLSDTDLLIADPERGIALAGVMGGLNTEINDSTTDVLIECAVFNPVGIRLTSRDRSIASESSRRFERGVDPEMTVFAATRAVELIQQLASGEVLAGTVDAYPRRYETRSIDLRLTRVNSVLDMNFDLEQVTGYLASLDCKVSTGKAPETLAIAPPSWRGDLEREIDLIEEVIRLHGYNEVVPATTSRVVLEPDVEREKERRLTAEIKDAAIRLGFREAFCWSLISPADSTDYPDGLDAPKVINPLSEDLSRLRTSLAQSLLRAVDRNLNNGISDVRLFEWGKCFRMEAGEISEGLGLGMIVTGNVRPESWIETTRPVQFADIRGLSNDFLSHIHLKETVIQLGEASPAFSYSCVVNSGSRKQKMGEFGLIASDVAAHFGIDVPVWYIEFDGDLLLSETGGVVRYEPLPRYPFARRDLALMVDGSLKVGDLSDCLQAAGGEILDHLQLFDVYSGKGIPEGKRSLAYHLLFRRADRTLADSEVESSVTRMVETARREYGAELRTL